MDKIIVIGGKGTAVNIAEHIVHAHRAFNCKQEFIGFAIDDESLGKEINGFPVLCKVADVAEKLKQPEVKVIFALYRPDVMPERIGLLAKLGFPLEKFASFVHPLAYLAPSVRLGAGNVVLSNVALQSNVVLGHCNVINSNVVIEHDTLLGNSNFIAASACIGAKVTIGDGNFIGLNSSVREFVKVADYSFVGMGSNLLSDLSGRQTVFGNPAKAKG